MTSTTCDASSTDGVSSMSDDSGTSAESTKLSVTIVVVIAVVATFIPTTVITALPW